ncbi:MAG: GNAT family N-acetyltransferase, partial [Parvularculaceae bacterium]|nr:GNAT family N-acetyltransferase [Parvularculaceae bacterium]
FHERLIANAFPLGAVELLRVSAGAEPFAWLFNFVDRGRVLFNVAGLAFESDNRFKPGLVAHALAIEDHLRRGADVYDFMAGDERYKTELGAVGPRFVSLALQRPRVKLRIEDGLRWIRNRTARAPEQPAP